MARVQLRQPFWDGRVFHRAGARLNLANPPKSAHNLDKLMEEGQPLPEPLPQPTLPGMEMTIPQTPVTGIPTMDITGEITKK